MASGDLTLSHKCTHNCNFSMMYGQSLIFIFKVRLTVTFVISYSYHTFSNRMERKKIISKLVSEQLESLENSQIKFLLLN